MADLPEVAERLPKWPDDGEPGQFAIVCSCGRWSFTGTVEEINKAAIAHDDSPWQNHIVSIHGRLAEAGSDA